MTPKIIHFMLGDGVRCNAGWEAPNACDDWAKVTCRNCLLQHAHTLETSIRTLERKPPDAIALGERVGDRLERYRQELTLIRQQLEKPA